MEYVKDKSEATHRSVLPALAGPPVGVKHPPCIGSVCGRDNQPCNQKPPGYPCRVLVAGRGNPVVSGYTVGYPGLQLKNKLS